MVRLGGSRKILTGTADRTGSVGENEQETVTKKMNKSSPPTPLFQYKIAKGEWSEATFGSKSKRKRRIGGGGIKKSTEATPYVDAI